MSGGTIDAQGRRKPEVQLPLRGCDSETLCAVTLTPLSALVPKTNAHSFSFTADAWTRSVFEIWVADVSCTVDVPCVPWRVTVEPLTDVIAPAAKPKFAKPLRDAPPGGGVGR